MEKVKVTREQAEAIEYLKKLLSDTSERKRNLQLIKEKLDHDYHWESPNFKAANEIPDDIFIAALHYGYEVEPKFEVGDWVVIDYKEHGTKVGKIKGYIKKDAFYIDNNHAAGSIMNTRHATPEEIVAEKERRWWAKHGRDVWELREGDILFDALYSVFQEVLRI